MKKKRNTLGQFTRENLEVTIKIPSLLEALKYLIIFILIMPWLYFLFYRLKIVELLDTWMEYVFSFGANGQENNAKDKKSNGFF